MAQTATADENQYSLGDHEDISETAPEHDFDQASSEHLADDREDLLKEDATKRRKRNVNIIIAVMVAVALGTGAYLYVRPKPNDFSGGNYESTQAPPVYQAPNQQAGQVQYQSTVQAVGQVAQAPVVAPQDPTTQPDVASSPAPAVAVDPIQTPAPTAAVSSVPVPIATQPAAVPQAVAVSQIASSATTDRLSILEGRVTTYGTRIDSIEARLDKHDQQIAALISGRQVVAEKPKLSAAAVIHADEAAPEVQHLAQATHHARSVIAKKEKQIASVTRLKQPAEALVNNTDDSTSTDLKTQVVTPVYLPKPVKSVKPTLAAIIPGRAFLQFNDGSRADVTVGDVVQDCGRVTKIDADSAEVTLDSCVIR